MQINFSQVEAFAGAGLTEEDICYMIGVKRANIYQREKTKLEFLESIKKGKLKVLLAVSNALYTCALNGNVRAMIFLLKCRFPEIYNKKYNLEQAGSTAINMDIQSGNAPVKDNVLDEITQRRLIKRWLEMHPTLEQKKGS